MQAPRFNPPDARIDMTPERESTISGGRDKVNGPQPWEGVAAVVAIGLWPPLLVESTRTLGFPHVNTDEGGGGVQPLCPIHHLAHNKALRVCGLLQRVQAAGDDEEVGVRVGGSVREATTL